MTARERFIELLSFKMPRDRLPMVEWAPYWDKTIHRWTEEGLPEMSLEQYIDYFGLDPMRSIGIPTMKPDIPGYRGHGTGFISSMADYEKIRCYLFQEEMLQDMLDTAGQLKQKHDEGQFALKVGSRGFFWFPRTLLGIEGHLFAFYDNAELMHKINSELSDFILKALNELFHILKPDYMTFAEDMSYNHGSMLSREHFNEFILPYYQKVIPHVKKYGIPVLVDSDGDITEMIPWLLDAGIDGVYPLERQAGVDICMIRKKYPGLLMLGGYDKMVMSLGENDMRSEFERILPVMRSGGYIPSVDHQVPPGVSLQNYRIYLNLLKEYCTKAIV